MRARLLGIALTLATGANAFCKNVNEVQDTVTLRAVEVASTRAKTATLNSAATLTTISAEALTEKGHGNILPTLAEAVPGLMVTSRGLMGYGVSGGAAGGINLRGLSSGNGQVLVMVDHRPQYQGVFGHSIADSYQTLMAHEVEVVRGPASVLCGGNAMGGVINILTKGARNKEDHVETELNAGAGSYGTVEATLANDVRKGAFSSNVGVQYGRSDNHRDNMGFQQYGGFVKLGYDVNNHWTLYADANVTHFSASQPGSLTKPLLEADQWITRGVANLGAEYSYAKVGGGFSAYDNFGIHKVNDGYTPGGKPQTELFRSKDALAGFAWVQHMHLWKGSKITTGADYQHIYGRAYYTSRETGEVVTTGRRGMQSTHQHNNEVAVYADVRQTWGIVTLNAGLRYDHHSVAGGEWIPQAGLAIQTTKTSTLKLTSAKGFRNPTMKEMFLYGTANDSLRAERIWNHEIAWTHTVCGGALTYGANVYYMKGDNMIATVAVDGKQRNMNTGEVENVGAEVEAAWRINTHWTLQTNHSYTHMEKPLLGTPEYKGYLGARMRYGKWQASVGLQQLSGLYTVLGTKDTKDKKENATLLNANVSYQVLKQLTLWLSGENLLAQRYEIISGYPMPKATFMAGVRVKL